jgi:importin-5
VLHISYETTHKANKMSMLPPEVQTTLTQLLQALSSGDNALRSQAEEQLNNDWTANRPDILLMGLVEQIQGAQDAAVCLPI